MTYKSRPVCLAGIQELSLILLYLLSALSLSKLIIWMYSNFLVLKRVSLTQIKDVTSTFQKSKHKGTDFVSGDQLFLSQERIPRKQIFRGLGYWLLKIWSHVFQDLGLLFFPASRGRCQVKFGQVHPLMLQGGFPFPPRAVHMLNTAHFTVCDLCIGTAWKILLNICCLWNPFVLKLRWNPK